MGTPVVTELSNGLTLIVEEVPHVASAAYHLIIPGGITTDRPGHEGSCLLLAEMMSRGAGELNSRQLSEAFDSIGAHHGESASQEVFVLRGSLLGSNMEECLKLVSLMLTKPQLPADDLESVRSLFLQDLAALQDNPARRVMIALGSNYYPGVWGRSPMGSEAGLKSVSAEQLRAEHSSRIRPQGAILSICGAVNAKSVTACVEKYFGAWQGKPEFPPTLEKFPARTAHHIHAESAQLQIALAYPSAKFGDPHYYTAKVATGILSGGMFGRLFIEVREKRGLCYSVRASHSATAAYGTVVAYAGTTPERAHETLDVMVEVLQGMKGDIEQEELERSQIDLKSSRIIGEESTGARAVGNATDWWLQRRIRPLQEVLDGISSVSATQIHEYLKAWPIQPFTLVTLGPRDLHQEAR